MLEWAPLFCYGWRMEQTELRKHARRGIELEIARLQELLKTIDGDGAPEPVAKRHWTQTPEGQLRMKEIQKKAWAARRRGGKKKKAPNS